MSRDTWTKAELRKMRKEYPHRQTKLIADDLGRSITSVYQRARIMGLSKSPAYLSTSVGRIKPGSGIGSSCRFVKGHTTWNKGMKGLDIGGKATRFKKGQLNGRAAKLVLPMGTYRVSPDGYLEQKFSTESGNPNKRWRSVHRLLWEAENGPVPEGYIVVFLPGMRTTALQAITLDKLELISRAENMRRNTYHRYPKEVARLVQLRGALNRQINKRANHE